MFAACKLGDCDAVLPLIDGGGANLERLDAEGRSPLYWACKMGHAAVVELLIEKGVDISYRYCGPDRDRENLKGFPLKAACEGGHGPVVSLLLKSLWAIVDKKRIRDAGFYDPDTNSYSCHLALLRQSACDGDTAIVSILLENGGFYDTEPDGLTPLYCAVANQYTDIVSMLLEKGANPNGSHGKYPLLIPLLLRNSAISELLLSKEVDLEYVIRQPLPEDGPLPWEGATPLILASDMGMLSVVSRMLEKGADVKKQSDAGDTALHSACQKGAHEIVKLLLDRGADIDKPNNLSMTPLLMVCNRGPGDVGGVATSIALQLLEKGADVRGACEHLCTPLHGASISGDADLAKLLISKGAPLNAVTTSPLLPGEDTPLTLACRHGHLTVVSLLIKNGANIEQATKDGRTPLLNACAYNHPTIVDELLSSGAAPDTPFPNGCRPILFAADKGYEQIVAILLKHGADATPYKDGINSAPWCPVVYASKGGHVGCAVMIQEHLAREKDRKAAEAEAEAEAAKGRAAAAAEACAQALLLELEEAEAAAKPSKSKNKNKNSEKEKKQKATVAPSAAVEPPQRHHNPAAEAAAPELQGLEAATAAESAKKKSKKKKTSAKSQSGDADKASADTPDNKAADLRPLPSGAAADVRPPPTPPADAWELFVASLRLDELAASQGAQTPK